jgi:bleomycin hydrolase
MGQTTSKIDEKEAVAGMGRLSLDKNAYVFVDNDSCM